jgi:hypothetical protein
VPGKGWAVRLMSFALTTKQVQRREKTVTRRLGWKNARPGQVLQPVVKGQGLKKGETVERINGPIRIVGVRRERLDTMIDDEVYGLEECAKEGFPTLGPFDFVFMFCEHNRCMDTTVVTRIEFEYLEPSRG